MVALVAQATLVLVIAGSPANVTGTWTLSSHAGFTKCETAITTPATYAALEKLFASVGGRVIRFSVGCQQDFRK